MALKFLKYLFILYFTFFSVSPTFASSISPLTVPTGGQVASGTININQSAPGKLVVNQTTNQGIINWQSFNVGVDAAVHFNTPNASAGTLNNISGGSSTILGSIYSNGRLFFANPSGIIFKPGSQVKAEGLVAGAMRISNQDFLANNFNFTNNQIASLQNEGNLEAHYVALIAPQVLNKGTITTNVATIIAAGDDVKLAISDSNRLSVNINPAKIKTLSSNEGVIKSENGTVSIQANVAQELIDQTINTPKSADKLISENGVIKLVSNSGSIKSKNVNLSAGPLGGTEVSGTIDVSSNTKGGDIEITGKEINVKSNSTLLATGETGGGNILVGGDWQGSNGVLQATYTTVEKDTVIDASSKGVGDGGKIVVWSDIKDPNSKTIANGQLISKANIGEGGKIETSGSSLDTENISVDAGSRTGKGGLWLVDPYDYVINAPQATSITNSLNGGTSVNILTSSNNTGYGSSGNINQNGDITINSPILASSTVIESNPVFGWEQQRNYYDPIRRTWVYRNVYVILYYETRTIPVSPTLTLTTSGNITSNYNIANGSNSSLNLILNAGGAINLTGNINASRGLTLNNGTNGTVSGIISGTGVLTKSGSGTLTLSGTNTYTGATTVSAGTLAVTANNALGTNAAGTTVASGATLDFQNINYSTTEALTVNGGTIKTSTGASTVAGTIALGANSTFDVGGTSLTSSGVISGVGALIKSGSGTLTLSGTYTGIPVVSSGTVVARGTTFRAPSTPAPSTPAPPVNYQNQVNIEKASIVKIIPNGTNAVYGTNNNNMTFNAFAGPNFSPSPTSGPKNIGPAAGASSGPQIISRFVTSATNTNNVKNPVRLRQTNLGNKPAQIQPNNQPAQIQSNNQPIQIQPNNQSPLTQTNNQSPLTQTNNQSPLTQPNNQQNPVQSPIGSGLTDESL